VDRTEGASAEASCPADVVDRLLWRNAHAILLRHPVRLGGTCPWCATASPCSPRRLAEQAADAARRPWHEAWTARNDITRLLPVVQPRHADTRVWRGRNLRPLGWPHHN
jgi:hypothetical protein